MRVDILGYENSVFKRPFDELMRLIADAEKKHSTKLFLDTTFTNSMTGISDVKVYLHGDRNVINLITIKMVNWQVRNLEGWRAKIYVHNAEDKYVTKKEKHKKASL